MVEYNHQHRKHHRNTLTKKIAFKVQDIMKNHKPKEEVKIDKDDE